MKQRLRDMLVASCPDAAEMDAPARYVAL